MKRYLLIATSLFAIFLGQTVLSRYFAQTSSYLDLFLIAVVYHSLKENPIGATLIGTAAGLIQDTFSSAIFGINGLSKMMIGFSLSTINARIMLQHPGAQIAVLILATFLNGIMLKGLSFFFSLKYIPQLFPQIFYQAGVNGVVGIIIIRLIFYYNKKRHKK